MCGTRLSSSDQSPRSTSPLRWQQQPKDVAKTIAGSDAKTMRRETSEFMLFPQVMPRGRTEPSSREATTPIAWPAAQQSVASPKTGGYFVIGLPASLN
jgi:hypothetical protein